MNKKRVLFLCTGPSALSQMAKGLEGLSPAKASTPVRRGTSVRCQEAAQHQPPFRGLLGDVARGFAPRALGRRTLSIGSSTSRRS